MQPIKRTLFALVHCVIIGGIYGAVCAIGWLEILGSIARLFQKGAAESAWSIRFYFASFIPGYCGFFGFMAGAVAGLIAGCLGGPLGWSIGGLVGGAVASWSVFGSGVYRLPDAIGSMLVPAMIGAVAALVFGWDVRRETPILPFAGWLAESVYASPLGRWFGWRKRRSGGEPSMPRSRTAFSALVQCGFFGALYGALSSLAWVGIQLALALIHHQGVEAYRVIMGIGIGIFFGLVTGFLGGVVGGGLGSPVGWGIASMASMILLQWCLGNAHFTIGLRQSLFRALVGAIAAFAFGWDIRRRVPILPGAGWLSARVYGSPLGGWPGWRKRQSG